MSKRCALLSSISIRLRPSSPGPVRWIDRSADDVTRSTQGASGSPRLRVIGNVTLGGVTVRN